MDASVDPPSVIQHMPSDALTGLRVNYVWDWWKVHAKQRTDMFNYFLIITGILANAFVNAPKGSASRIMPGLSLLGIVISVGFIVLDVRNTRQLDKASVVLGVLEKTDLGVPDGHRLAGGAEGRMVRQRVVIRAAEAIIAGGWLITFFIR